MIYMCNHCERKIEPSGLNTHIYVYKLGHFFCCEDCLYAFFDIRRIPAKDLPSLLDPDVFNKEDK